MKTIVIIALLIRGAWGLIGYDCGSSSLNITTLSLLEVAPCEPPINNINVTKRYIQLLQINNFVETTIYQCKIEIRRTVYHCGMFSHISIVKNGETDYISEISHQDCLGLFTTGTLNIGYNRYISRIRVNATTSRPMLFAGDIRDGGCKGAVYSDPYGTWDDVVVQGTIRITIKKQTARVEINTNKVHLPSGTICTLSDETCVDVEGGYTFWKPIPTDSCGFYHYGILYEGLANKIMDSTYNKEQTVYSLSTQDVTFALAIKNRDSVCGYVVYRTEHPKLLIFETVQGESFAPRDRMAVSNLDIFAYVNSKFVYVEKHVKSQMQSLYNEVVIQRCRLERQTLKNALAIASAAPDQFAYHLMKGPGYMALTAGEVVHVVKCVPVEVNLQKGEHCYSELQVERKNETYFMTPITHILKRQGNRIDCSEVLPVMFRTDKSWCEILPRPRYVPSPPIIRPLENNHWEYESPKSLATGGIYTEEDLNMLKNHIMFPVEKGSVLNDFAREVQGQPLGNKQGTIFQLLNEDAMEKIAQSTWTRMWGKFITFGAASAGIIAIFVIVQTIKMIVEVLINGYMLHQIYGCSTHLLGALWTSLAQFLIYLSNPPKSNEPGIVINIEENDEQKHLQAVTNQPSSSNAPEAPVRVSKAKAGFFSINP